jgi:hypothetical protein
VFLAIERFWKRSVPWRIGEESSAARFLYPFRVLFTFLVFTFCLVIFRSPSLGTMKYVFGQMFSGLPGNSLFQPYHTGLILAWMALEVWEERRGWFDRLAQAPAWAMAAALVAVFLVLELFGVTDVSIPFIYFQF